MKLVIFSLFVLSCIIICVKSECCGKYTLRYTVYDYVKSEQGKCGGIAGSSYYADRGCRIDVCNDGRTHPGSYCGQGSCNFFGCNCDGGCIRGPEGSAEDPVGNFKNENWYYVDRAWVNY